MENAIGVPLPLFEKAGFLKNAKEGGGGKFHSLH
jgi:hypothetical protein